MTLSPLVIDVIDVIDAIVVFLISVFVIEIFYFKRYRGSGALPSVL